MSGWLCDRRACVGDSIRKKPKDEKSIESETESMASECVIVERAVLQPAESQCLCERGFSCTRTTRTQSSQMTYT